MLLPLLAIIFWIGIYPKPFFAFLEKPVQRIIQQVNPAFYQRAADPSSGSFTSSTSLTSPFKSPESK